MSCSADKKKKVILCSSLSTRAAHLSYSWAKTLMRHMCAMAQGHKENCRALYTCVENFNQHDLDQFVQFTSLDISDAFSIQRRNLFVFIKMTWTLSQDGIWPNLSLTTRRMLKMWGGRIRPSSQTRRYPCRSALDQRFQVRVSPRRCRRLQTNHVDYEERVETEWAEQTKMVETSERKARCGDYDMHKTTAHLF